MSGNIVVRPTDNGRFKVLRDGIQYGIEYSSEALANLEADKLRKL